jgi:hypothetical protein
LRSKRQVIAAYDLLHGEADEAEPREHYQPITERPPECLGGDFTLAGSRCGRQPAIEAECLPAQHRVQDPASHEARTDRKAAPIVAQAVWIEETLKDAPGGVAEKPNNDHEQQRTAEWLSEDGRERAARPVTRPPALAATWRASAPMTM